MTCKYHPIIVPSTAKIMILFLFYLLRRLLCSVSFVPGAPSRPTLSLTGEAVSPPALLAVVPNPASPNPLEVGTLYPFNNHTYSPSYSDVIDFYLEGELIPLSVRLDGYCTRTGTSDNTVIGYCHFTYTAEDPQAFANIGQFVVEGTLTNPSMSSSNPCGGLHVTGGTGIYCIVWYRCVLSSNIKSRFLTTTHRIVATW